MSDTKKALQGIKWNYAATAIQMVAQLGFVAVVARLLDPAAFGVMAMATVVIRFGSYLSGAGIRSYLIQRPTLTSADIGAAFALTGAVGALFGVTAFWLAPVVATLYDSPAVEPVVRVLALSFLASGLTIPAGALLQRALRFRAVASIETTAYVIGYPVIGLLLALQGLGVWSLVAAALSQQMLVLILSLIAAPHRIGAPFGLAELTEVATKGSHFAANTILDYCVIAAPTLVVGKHFGAADLGIYNRSSTLITLPTYAVSSAVSRVVLPYIAPLQSDHARLGRVYARSTTLSTLVFLPVCLASIPAAREIVLLVLGDRWLEAIPVFQVLALATALHLVAVQLTTCADAVRRLTARTAISVVTLAAMVVAMYALMEHGLVGAAAGVAIGQATRLSLYAFLLGRWFGLSARDLLHVYAPGTVVGLVAALSTGIVHQLLGHAPVGAVFLAELLAGATAFAAGVLLYPNDAFKTTLSTLLSHLGFRGRIPLVTSALRSAGIQ